MNDFPHNHIYRSKDLPIFYGCVDSVVKHVSTFIIYCKKNDFLHEDVMMKYFSMSLKGSADIWYESLGKGMFLSFAEFLEAFCLRWDYDLASWLLLVHEIRDLYVSQRLIENSLGLPMEDIEIKSNNKDHKICIEDVHHSSPSHELLSHDHSSSKKDDKWEAYLKILEEMDKASMNKE
jgi:hypothetical protein